MHDFILSQLARDRQQMLLDQARAAKGDRLARVRRRDERRLARAARRAAPISAEVLDREVVELPPTLSRRYEDAA